VPRAHSLARGYDTVITIRASFCRYSSPLDYFAVTAPESWPRTNCDLRYPRYSDKMADLAGRKVFKVFNQDFIVDERYTVTKELGQGAYGIVWYSITCFLCSRHMLTVFSTVPRPTLRPMKELRSRRSPMSSARRFWPSVR
jgi:hypothetical protein